MNKIILLIYLGFISGLSFGQKCNAYTDPFTKTDVVTYDFGKYIIFSLKNNEIWLRYQLQFDGNFIAEIPKGSTISFLLENGNIVELSSAYNASPITITGSAQSMTSYIVTEYFVTMKLTKEQLEALARSPMKYVRYPDLNGGYISDNKSKRWRKKLIEGAQCIEAKII